MPRPSGRRVARGVGAGLLLGAFAAVAAEAFRPRPGPARIVDWDEVRERAHARLGDETTIDPRRRRRLEDQYRRLAEGVQEPLLEFVGGLPQGVSMPAFQALDRNGWVDLNVAILRDGLEPVLAVQEAIPNSRAVELTRAVIDRYVAVLLGFLSRRVLGQYDPQLLGREPTGEPGVYLVEPNIAEWQEDALLPGEPLRRWLILHEMTHAWQFAAHPWLRGHLNSMVSRLIGAAVDRRTSALDRVLGLTLGVRQQLQVINEVQAVMSLIEGYSNLVMSVVGKAQIKEYQDLEEAHSERVSEKTVFERLFWRLTGLELKLQQYVVGERFCRHVHDQHGIAALNRAWDGPSTLPTLGELRDPDRWWRRVSGVELTNKPGRRRTAARRG